MDFLGLPQLSQPKASGSVREDLSMHFYVNVIYKVFMGVKGEVVIKKRKKKNKPHLPPLRKKKKDREKKKPTKQ